MTYDVVIIGSGLGGLECGYILSRHGLKVCVLEKNTQIGGCLQTFKRFGETFDTGFHYVGGLDEGQNLNRLFKYFGLLDLPWKRLDNNFDEVVIDKESFMFVNGHEQFVDNLSKRFPHQRQNLSEYIKTLKGVGDNMFNSFLPRNAEDFYGFSLFAKSAHQYLTSIITDPLLVDVLSGTSLKMELNAEKLPLYVFAQINNSFIQSAWRLVGGGMQIAEKLRANILSMGGEVLTNAEVVDAIEVDGKISSVKISGNDEPIEAKYFISNAHPAATMSWLTNCSSIRKIYRKRICSLPNTFGMFTVNLKLKPNTVPYLNRNVYVYKNRDLWSAHNIQPNSSVDSVLISFQPPTDGSAYVSNIDILTPMNWADVSKWFGTKIGRRGDEYEILKQKKAEECINLAAEQIAGLQGAVDKIFTSTPLTYTDYTSTQNGSSYGIQKDCNNLLFTMLTPKTPISNLYMTGQNLNLHGILGVSMTSFFTCAEILGMDSIIKDLNN